MLGDVVSDSLSTWPGDFTLLSAHVLLINQLEDLSLGESVMKSYN